MASDRAPPYSEESEIGTLGSCLLDATAVAQAMESRITSDHFYLPHHRIIWEAIEALSSGGNYNRVDILTVQRELSKHDNVEQAGGEQMLEALIDRTPTSAHVDYHINELKTCQRIRQALGISHMIQDAVHEGIDPDTLLSDITKEACRVERDDEVTLDDCHQKQVENRERAKSDGIVGYPTCIPDLAGLISSYQPPDNVVIAAKSSHGKTTFAINEFLLNAKQGTPCGFFTTDMSKYRMYERMAANIAGINPFRFNYTTWTDRDAGMMDDAYEQLKSLPIYINDNGRATCGDVIAQATTWAVRHGIKMFCVDFLQQLNLTSDEAKMGKRIAAGLQSNAIKAVGKQFDMVTFIISQLARYGDKTSDQTPPVPNKEMLKESGDIENNADLIILLAPEPGRDKEDYTFKAQMWDMVANVDKARNGPTGIVPLSYRPSRHKFMSRTQGDIIKERLDETKTLDPHLDI